MAEVTVHFLEVYQLHHALERLWAQDTGKPDPPASPVPEIPDAELRVGVQQILRRMPGVRLRGFLWEFFHHCFLNERVTTKTRRVRDIAGFIVWLEQDLGVELP